MSAVNGGRFNVAAAVRGLLSEYPDADASRLWELCVERGMDVGAVSRNAFRVACSIARKKMSGGAVSAGAVSADAVAGGAVSGGAVSADVGSGGPEKSSRVKSSREKSRSVNSNPVKTSLVKESSGEKLVPSKFVGELSGAVCGSDRVRLAAEFLCACGYDLAVGKSLLESVSELRVLWVGDSGSGGSGGAVPL